MRKNGAGVKAVIFDLSGTVIDFGSRGPVVAFVELFGRHGIAVTEEEARRPMGTAKRDHIWAMLSDPEIAHRWRSVKGTSPDIEALDALYREFTPLQIEVLRQHCEVLPGVSHLTAELDARGIPYAATTGFDSSMMPAVVQSATSNGFNPKVFVTPDLAGGGRPAPWMAFHAARQMGVYPMSAIVKVGDTPADIAEAQNAGMWAVGVVSTGNEIGLSQAEWESLSDQDRDVRFALARERLQSAGAHYVIGSAADLLPVIDQIGQRTGKGERP
jgi:phosphonoacetaldehyde hydrolase